MPPLLTPSRQLRLSIRFAALVLFALALGGASRGYAQPSASPGGSVAAASTPAPACSSDNEQSSPQSAQDILNGFDPGSETGAYATTAAYVAQFYPLWFTYNQAKTFNKLVGPDRVTPIYNAVVLINVDTVYASAFLDLTEGPVVLTIPETPVNYSIFSVGSLRRYLSDGAPVEYPGRLRPHRTRVLGRAPPRRNAHLNAPQRHDPNFQGRQVCIGQLSSPIRG